jgi:hypothetical protein
MGSQILSDMLSKIVSTTKRLVCGLLYSPHSENSRSN